MNGDIIGQQFDAGEALPISNITVHDFAVLDVLLFEGRR